MKRMVISLFLICAGGPALFSLTANEILKKVDLVRAPGNSFKMKMRVKTFSEGKIKDAYSLKGYIKGGNKSMIAFTAPGNWKGKKILMKGNDMWMIFPHTSRPIRITPAQRLMGEVANGDVARVAFSTDYDAKIVGEETVNGKACYHLKLRAKSGGASYKTIDLWVKKKGFFPVKASFYALSGKKLKEAFYKNIKMLGGQMRPSIVEIHDAVKKSSVSVMEYLFMEKAKISERFFNKNYLLRM